MISRVRLAAFLLFALASTSKAAWADATEEQCIAAAVDGQKLRKNGLLLQARATFGTCSRIECPKEIVERCTGWLSEVDALVPSIVVSVQDESGRDVLDAAVTIDGVVRDLRSGKAVEVEPGVHAIEAKTPTQSANEDVVVREGERARLIRLVFKAPVVAPKPKPLPPPRANATLRTLSIASFATSAVATGFFIGFASVGIADRDRFGCAKGCSPGDYSQVSNELVAADVMLVVAGVTLATGVVLWLLSRPSQPVQSSAMQPAFRW